MATGLEVADIFRRYVAAYSCRERRSRRLRRHLAPLHRADWVVYAKRPFGGPEQVLAIVDRYTHRVAIANSRLMALDDGRVSFRWKDYRDHDKQKS